MKKIVFVVPSINDSHCKNRILEFQERGYNVEVMGFSRAGQKTSKNLPYGVRELGELQDENYIRRIALYISTFKRIKGNIDLSDDVVFYLNGLDIAMFFHYFNPGARYIYEECDLTHTYLRRLKAPLEWVDKRIIKHSLLTITTSQGFIDYHWKGVKPENVVLVENKLNPTIMDYPVMGMREFSPNQLSIGFVGGPRFDSVYNFIDVFCRHFPSSVFHVYGGPIPAQFESLKQYPNCIFHGFFKNPVDLPSIYASIDIVLATYDTKFENVKYAEPNKIYESIFFETPIIVSSGTFLASKVKKLGIGYDIDPLDENEIVDFIKSLTKQSVEEKKQHAKNIDKESTLNINDHLFKMLERILKD